MKPKQAIADEQFASLERKHGVTQRFLHHQKVTTAWFFWCVVALFISCFIQTIVDTEKSIIALILATNPLIEEMFGLKLSQRKKQLSRIAIYLLYEISKTQDTLFWIIYVVVGLLFAKLFYPKKGTIMKTATRLQWYNFLAK